MFEDIPRNLEAPHALGMTTVLVRSEANHDHPVQQMIRSWVEPPEHVHHMTYDLAGFLLGVRVEGIRHDPSPARADIAPDGNERDAIELGREKSGK